MSKYTIRNNKGELLKYVFANELIFNGDNPNSRRHFVCRVSKFSTAEELLDMAHFQGIGNAEIVQLNFEPKTQECGIRKTHKVELPEIQVKEHNFSGYTEKEIQVLKFLMKSSKKNEEVIFTDFAEKIEMKNSAFYGVMYSLQKKGIITINDKKTFKFTEKANEQLNLNNWQIEKWEGLNLPIFLS